jgi:Tol biopolymer transport system component
MREKKTKPKFLSISLLFLLIVLTLITCEEDEVVSRYNPIQITFSYHSICPGAKYAPRCSPIDDRLAFVGVISYEESDDYTIWTLDIKTGEYNYVGGCKIQKHPVYISWSPDAQYILYYTDEPNENPELQYVRVTADENEYIVNTPITIPTPEGHKPWQPDWSPDGEWIVYSNYADGYIWKIRPDGSNPTRITRGMFPRWSPDGTMIAFSDDNGDTRDDIYTIPAEDGEPTLIVSGEYDDTQPDWSPDGEYIAYSIYRGLNFDREDIFVVSSSGGEPIQITNSWPDDEDSVPLTFGHMFPTWSYDGENIIFWSCICPGDFPSQLFKINPKEGWDFQ